MTKLDKAQLRQRGRELRALLQEWDPIGVGPDGPRDEYDCLLWPVMRRLEGQLEVGELAAFLDTELREHFGQPGGASDSRAFASRAIGWFEARWKGTRA